MLAYVFWHRPLPEIGRGAYEDGARRFQAALLRAPSPGLIDATSWQIPAVPWLGDAAGYEDWCFLQGSWAMDPLNAFAVAGERQPSHEQVAAQMAYGAGGLYAHIWGDRCRAPASTVAWLTRPRGIAWRPALERLRATIPDGAFWRRQMVLGPAPEFAVEIPREFTVPVPEGWEARHVRRERLSG
jgi:hypothetical protein